MPGIYRRPWRRTRGPRWVGSKVSGNTLSIAEAAPHTTLALAAVEAFKLSAAETAPKTALALTAVERFTIAFAEAAAHATLALVADEALKLAIAEIAPKTALASQGVERFIASIGVTAPATQIRWSSEELNVAQIAEIAPAAQISLTAHTPIIYPPAAGGGTGALGPSTQFVWPERHIEPERLKEPWSPEPRRVPDLPKRTIPPRVLVEIGVVAQPAKVSVEASHWPLLTGTVALSASAARTSLQITVSRSDIQRAMDEEAIRQAYLVELLL